MDDVLSGLNDAQKAAVTSKADVLQVLAPPGSGKTKTLTARVGYLINHHGFEPRNIIVCTFTVKAAREMQDRISAFLGKDKASRLVLGTFHSIARRYLAVYGDKIELDKKFSIADTSDTLGILKRIIKSARLTIDPKVARARISSLKSQSITSERFNVSSKKADEQEIARVYMEYEDHLKLSKLLDFDDLLLRCTELLRRYPSCVSNLEAVLIDEFQDTNNVQYDLMTLFAQEKRRITIVGDPDQSIYGWRNAEIRNLSKMRDEYPDTHVAMLHENYRSSGAILLTAQEVIEQDQARPSKKLMATLSVGMRPVLRRLETAADEAMWIVCEIQRTSTLTGELLRWSDFAILLRSAALSRHVESVLGKVGLPYKMVGGLKFFDRLEVKLVLDYLRVIHHPSNNDSIARVLNVPSRRLGDATIQKLLDHAKDRKLTLWAVVLGLAQGTIKFDGIASAQVQGLELFTNIILSSQKKLHDAQAQGSSLADFIRYVIKKADLEDHLRKTKAEDFDSRWANVQELITQADDVANELARNSLSDDELAGMNELQVHEACNGSTAAEALTYFLANVALSADSQKNADSERPTEQITISTIHAAKGLEWPVVFIPGAYEGSIPHSRAEDHDEERRLLYVAMTRAQSLLYLSCPLQDSASKETKLSSFLEQKPMGSYFDQCGADLGYTVASEMSTILRRPCPDRNMLDRAMASIEYANDNQWPLLGYDDMGEKNGQYETGKGYDRRRTIVNNHKSAHKARGPSRMTEVQGMTVATTMKDHSGYTVSTATLKTGFMTASTAMVTMKQQDHIAQPARAGVKAQGHSSGSKRKLSEVATNVQAPRNLTSFFTSRMSSNHSVDSGHHTTTSNLVAGRDQFAQPLADVTNTHTSNSANQHTDPAAVFQPPIKAASTMHTTSMIQVAQAVPRKTLGVRRSMKGWPPQKPQEPPQVRRLPP